MVRGTGYFCVSDIEGLLQGLDLGSLTGGSGPGGLQIDHQMAERVRALIRHFKQVNMRKQ